MKATTLFIASVLMGCSGAETTILDPAWDLNDENQSEVREDYEDNSYEDDADESFSCGKTMRLPVLAPDGTEYFIDMLIPCDYGWVDPSYPVDRQNDVFDVDDWLKQFKFDDASLAVFQTTDC